MTSDLWLAMLPVLCSAFVALACVLWCVPGVPAEASLYPMHNHQPYPWYGVPPAQQYAWLTSMPGRVKTQLDRYTAPSTHQSSQPEASHE